MPPMNEDRSTRRPLTLAAIRERLASRKGRNFWRSLQELAGTDEFQRLVDKEFPSLAPAWELGLDRREMLKLMGASLALAGLTACSNPPAQRIVPYVHEPEGLVPGRPLFYATAMPIWGLGIGVLAESHLGRPTKIEGNPQHPASLGSTDTFAQASILGLYDPDRSQAVAHEGRTSSWTAFSTALDVQLKRQLARRGAGLRILTQTISSPTLASQLQAVLKRFPEAKWHQYEADNADNAYEGGRLAFGQAVNTCYRLDQADVILSLDSDLLTHGPAWVRYAREWAARRQRNSGPAGMNRTYVVESTPTCTGAAADHRLPLRARDIELFARQLAHAIAVNVPARSEEGQTNPKWVTAVARDLQQHRGRSLIVPGEYQPPAVHALAHAMNEALGNRGTTVIHTDPAVADPVNQTQSLHELAEEMRQGRVELLVIIAGNPAFDSPADIDFAGALQKVPFRVHMGLYQDETAALCQWHVPETHYLESWGDVRAYDGTVTILQPLIAPLYGGRMPQELLALVQGAGGASGYDIVHAYWQSQHTGGDFDRFWRASLEAGVVPDTALPARSVSFDQNWTSGIRQNSGHDRQGLEIIFRPDPGILDGRFANNGWLQELPKPLSKLTWDNAALMGPATAERLGIDIGEVSVDLAKGRQTTIVRLSNRGRSVRAPVLILPGHPEDSITVHFGCGRTRAGKVGSGVGFNAYALRGSDAPWFNAGLEVQKLDVISLLATTQQHHTMAGRDLVRVATEQELRNNPDIIRESGEPAPGPGQTIYPKWNYHEYKWGMTVNLSSCIGCNACIVACNSENNIPIVGKVQTGMGREMQWLRIDTYFEGSPEHPKMYFEPVLCMQCEEAPCELVCPVQATNHSSEGINQMVYNRCVGTRYCSNNCPYKVRRFNFFQYSDWVTPSLKPMRNPDVTVRGRGVMEKCTYCIQRIQEAKIRASEENRSVRDGEMMTACQQACPTRVFTFGDLNDRDSAVSHSASDPLNYGLLTELNTRPRTTYLADLKNPNPELQDGVAG